MCKAKRARGLGLKNIHLWNLAAIGKHIRNISEKKDILWMKWVATVYLKGNDFWTHIPVEQSSWYWRKIVDEGPVATWLQEWSMAQCAIRCLFYCFRL